MTRYVYPDAIAILEPHAEVDYHDSRDGLDPDALRARVADVDAIVSQLTDPITGEIMDAAPRLKVIANVAVGFDNVDVAAATERRVLVTNTPGILTEATADFTWALMLAAARRVPEADRFVRDGRWRQWEIDLLCGRDIHGSTLGIVGPGRIGRAVARRATGFGMRVLWHGRSPLPEDVDGTAVSLDELLATSDVVSLHLPLSQETRHLIGARELALMKPDALLVNTARGSIVDEAALVEALASGRPGAAALDVFEDEPRVDPRLLDCVNVVLAPHLASASGATRMRMCTMAAESVVDVLSGRRPSHVVNG